MRQNRSLANFERPLCHAATPLEDIAFTLHVSKTAVRSCLELYGVVPSRRNASRRNASIRGSTSRCAGPRP